MFTRAIVREVSKKYEQGLTTSSLGAPNYELARQQHADYIEALKSCGLDVTVLPADERYPDSTFVEDPAIVTSRFAIINNLGATTRKGEEVDIAAALRTHYENIEYIREPGTVEGGDILHIEDHFYIGVSSRTNENGAAQLQALFAKYDYESTLVPVQQFFHLKTGVTWLGNNRIVATGEFVNHPAFANFELIMVDKKEEYATNCLRINQHVLIPRGFPKTRQRILDAGYTIIELDMSEFQKQDGGLTCLSLRF